MSPRPRIRSIKPEMGQDEKFGQLSRDARLLFIGLISIADDDGRFRALPSVILGHWFPYDGDAARKLEGWLSELVARSMTALYEVDGVRYGVLPQFTVHQRINRPTPSVLPEPSVSVHGSFTEQSLSDHGAVMESSSPRVRGGDRIGSDRRGSDLTTLPAEGGSEGTPTPSAGLFKEVLNDLERRAS